MRLSNLTLNMRRGYIIYGLWVRRRYCDEIDARIRWGVVFG